MSSIKKVLTRIDAVVGTNVAAQMRAHPDSVIAVVSDHGFSKVDTEVNLYRAFIDAGLKADPRNWISEIAAANQVTEMAGYPEASFYVGFKTNAYAGAFKGAGALIVSPSGSKGMRGYFPADNSVRSGFMMMGKNVPKGRNLGGDIDMRAIAPTPARAMGLTLPDAEVAALI